MNTALKEKTAAAADLLRRRYPDAVCSLDYGGEPWKLLVMAIMSAQCTDERVNRVSRELFAEFPTADALATAEPEDIRRIMRPCGMYKDKSEYVRESCAMLCGEFRGVLPDNMDGLLRFPGVGRKVANLLLGDIYGKPAVVTDTHCMRICRRLGLYPRELDSPVKIEKILSELIEPSEQSGFCHRLVLFGRDICSAKSPRCDDCPLYGICDRQM